MKGMSVASLTFAAFLTAQTVEAQLASLTSDKTSVAVGEAYTLTVETNGSEVHVVKLDGANFFTVADCTMTAVPIICKKSVTRSQDAPGSVTHTLTSVLADGTPRPALTLTIMVAGGVAIAPRSAATVTVDPATTYQTISNFGSSHRVFDDPHLWKWRDFPPGPSLTVMTRDQQDEVLDLLYRHGGLTYMRILTDGGLQPSRGVFNYEWNRLDAQIDDALRAQQRGPVKIAFTLLRYPPEAWMENAVRDYADYYVAVVNRARAKGLSIDYLTFNEPPVSGEFMRDVIKAVTSRVPSELRWLLPEAVKPSAGEGPLRILLADRAVRSVTAAVATHLYEGEHETEAMARLKAMAEAHNLPLWMSEYSKADPWEWARLQHRLLVTDGVSAVDYMWGFFGAYDPAQLLVGESDSDGRYAGVRPRKHFAVMGQWSRYVKPGSKRVSATSDDVDLLVSAFTSSTQAVLVAYNPTNVAKTVTIRMPGPAIEAARTSPSEDLVALPPMSLTGGVLATTLPPSSVTTFVSGLSGASATQPVP